MESMPQPIKAFLAAVAERVPALRPQIEPGGEKAGNWWIDLAGRTRVTVEWRPDSGFGLFIGDLQGYGEGPAEVSPSPERAAHRVAQLLARPTDAGPTGLRAVRELYGVTQDQMATRLKKGQAAISRLEARNDSKIETLGQYVKALGGKLEIRAVFPDGQWPVYQTAEPHHRQARSRLNLVVLRARNAPRLAAFYSKLGLTFVQHRHGTGPEHFACEDAGQVFEIYPERAGAEPTLELRLGFEVADLRSALSRLVKAGGEVVSEPAESPWGLRAVVIDLEGHKVELTSPITRKNESWVTRWDGQPSPQPSPKASGAAAPEPGAARRKTVGHRKQRLKA